MTIVRRAALGVSQFVTHYASPGWDDWLAGLNREMDFIERDWKSLAWALGSARVLLDYRPAPIRTYADLTDAAQRFANERRKLVGRSWLDRNSMSFSLLVFALIFWMQYLRQTSTQIGLGYRLLIVACITCALHSLTQRRKSAPADSDEPYARIRFYQDELRKTSSFTSIDLWIRVLGVIVIAIGTGLTISVPWERILFLLLDTGACGMMLVVLQSYRNNRRKLLQIATVLTERETLVD